jgi:hypothetical protein
MVVDGGELVAHVVITFVASFILRRGESAASPYHLMKEWIPTAASSQDVAYGGIVQLAANGRRLLVASSLPANVQVWEETPIGWKWKSQISLVNDKSDTDTKLLDFAVDEFGTRLVASVETQKGDVYARIYERVHGASWEHALGDGLDLKDALVNASGSSPTRGLRVAMSGDGRVVAVAMPYVNRRSLPDEILYNRTGVVQMFQNVGNPSTAAIRVPGFPWDKPCAGICTRNAWASDSP